MKVKKVLSDISDKIDSEIAWRKKELVNIKNLITEEEKEEARFFRRSAIALSYAHLEGGVKNIFLLYIKFLNNLLKEKMIALEDNEIIQDLIFYDKRTILTQNTREKRLKFFKSCIEILLNGEIEKLKIDKSIVNTKSNLSYKVLEDIYELFDISMNREIEIEAKFIDELVDRRNHVAHGEKKDYAKDIVIESIEKVIRLLELIREDILSKMGEFDR